MTSDFGTRKKRTQRAWTIALGVIAVGAVGYVVADAMIGKAAEKTAEQKAAAYWTVKGPPCQVSSQAGIAASKVRLDKGFAIGDVEFRYGYGDLNCREFHSDVRDVVGGELICQFTGPSALQVTTPKGEAFFITQGSPGTIRMKDGQASCVLASHFVPGADNP